MGVGVASVGVQALRLCVVAGASRPAWTCAENSQSRRCRATLIWSADARYTTLQPPMHDTRPRPPLGPVSQGLGVRALRPSCAGPTPLRTMLLGLATALPATPGRGKESEYLAMDEAKANPDHR